MHHRCFGITKNLHRCNRYGDWRFFCKEHSKQPIIWLVFVIFTLGAGTASILSYVSSVTEKRISQYSITKKQQIDFTSVLSNASFNKEEIKLGCAGNSEKACVFAGELFVLFRESGWNIQNNKVERVALGVPLPGVALFRKGEGKHEPSNPKAGLWVKQTDSLVTVKNAFEEIAIYVEVRSEPKFPDNVIGVFVGPPN